MTAAAGRPQRGGLSIGAVLAQLRAEFPDVTISKIRFLESEGLVRPARTAAGYRQFAAADVERLRYVLAAQRDRYLPLKVIKEHLDAADSRVLRAVDGAPEHAASGAPAVSGVHAASVAHVGSGVNAGSAVPAASGVQRMTCEDLLARSGLDAAALAELEQYGLVKSGAAGYYDQDALQVATTVREMSQFGLEPRHLRQFRAAADREVGLVEQVVTPLYRQRDPWARSRADEVVRELSALSVTLHTLLVKIGLRDLAGGRVPPR